MYILADLIGYPITSGQGLSGPGLLKETFLSLPPNWKIFWRPKKAKICLVMIFAKTDCRDQSVNNFRVGANIGESLIVLPTFQFVCVISK